MLALLPIDEPILATAARLTPRSVRSLDAIHLATAQSLGEDLGAMVAYDRRLCAAARSSGMSVLRPGARGEAA
jgi:predicted nucleic acid-binding protein